MRLNDNFNMSISTYRKENNHLQQYDPENILEIFGFRDEETMISYDFIEFIKDKEKKSYILSDFFLRNIFVDLKRFSQNKFETNLEDISFTRINI